MGSLQPPMRMPPHGWLQWLAAGTDRIELPSRWIRPRFGWTWSNSTMSTALSTKLNTDRSISAAMIASASRQSLHRPRNSIALRPRLPAAKEAKPYLHRHRFVQPRKRFLVEGLVAALAMSLFTSVAIAAPDVLKQSPTESLRDLAGLLLPGSSKPDQQVLIECP